MDARFIAEHDGINLTSVRRRIAEYRRRSRTWGRLQAYVGNRLAAPIGATRMASERLEPP